MKCVFAIGYGGQDEIARAVCDLAKTGTDMTQVTRKDILAHIETSQFAPPDMIVRTG
jgi:undecaprenyl pyrophosphate synthase